MARPTGPVRALRTALPALALALGLVAPGRGAAQGPPPPPGPRPGGRGVHRRLERPRPRGRAGPLRPRRRGARAAGGGAGRRVGHPRPAGGARLPGGLPRRRDLRPQRPRLGGRPPADRGVGGGALRAAATASRRTSTAPPGTRWAGRTGSSSTPSSACRASARSRATRRRWCAAAGSRGSPWSCRPRRCSGGSGEVEAAARRAGGDPPRRPARGRAERPAQRATARRPPPNPPPGLAPGAGRPRRPRLLAAVVGAQRQRRGGNGPSERNRTTPEA